jgi:anti-sigma B factor antagonist
MQLKQHRLESVVVLEVSGPVTLDGGATNLKETLLTILARGDRRVVLDLQQCTMVDSTGVGQFVACQISAMNAGATLKLANATKRLKDLLLLTRLLTVFECHDSVESAVESF